MEQPAMDSEVVDIPASDDVEVSQDENLDIPSDEVEQEAEEEDEIEVDGKKFVLPKSAAEKLKAERLMQADYTRKTQEVAEQRRAIEQQAQQIQQQAKFQQEYIAEVAKVTAIDERLAEYAKVNLSDYIESDPVAVMKAQEEIRKLQMQRAEVVNNLNQKQQMQAMEQQQTTAKQLQQASEYLAREISGWSDQRSNELRAYAISLGVPEQAIPNLVLQIPAIAKAFDKANQFDKLVKDRTTKPKQDASTPPPTRITAKSGGAQKDPDKMSSDEWLKWRESQIKRNR